MKAQKAYDLVKAEILKCTLKPGQLPGQLIDEKDLIGKLKTSRTPVREALLQLQTEGFIRTVPNRGYFVNELTVKDLKELCQVRLILEVASADLAAQKSFHQPDLLEKLGELSECTYELGNFDSYLAFIQDDTALHVTIAELTENSSLVSMVKSVRNQLQRYLLSLVSQTEQPLQSEHRALFEAIRDHDCDKARRIMSEHVRGSMASILGVQFSASLS